MCREGYRDIGSCRDVRSSDHIDGENKRNCFLGGFEKRTFQFLTDKKIEHLIQ